MSNVRVGRGLTKLTGRGRGESMAKIEIVYDGKGNVLVADHMGATEFFFCDYNVPEKLTKLLSEVLDIACGGGNFGDL